MYILMMLSQHFI